MAKETTRELMEQIILHQKSRGKNDLQITANISILMNKQEDLRREQTLFHQKISSYLFTDSETNREGYIAKQDILTERMTTLETKHKITAGKVGVSIFILSAIGGFFLWAISLIWK
jgi:hypothetical protein